MVFLIKFIKAQCATFFYFLTFCKSKSWPSSEFNFKVINSNRVKIEIFSHILHLRHLIISQDFRQIFELFKNVHKMSVFTVYCIHHTNQNV